MALESTGQYVSMSGFCGSCYTLKTESKSFGGMEGQYTKSKDGWRQKEIGAETEVCRRPKRKRRARLIGQAEAV